MAKFYYVSLLSKQMSSEYEEPYGQAVLNAIRSGTDITANIILAATNVPLQFINRVYREGAKQELVPTEGFPYGLPKTELADGWIADYVALKAQILLDHPTIPSASVTNLSAYITTGANLSALDAAKYDVSYNSWFNGLPIGLMEDDSSPNTIAGVHREFPAGNLADPENKILRRTVAHTPALQPQSPEANPWYREIYFTDDNNDDNELNDPLNLSYHYSISYTYHKYLWLTDEYGNTSLVWSKIHVTPDPAASKTTVGTFPKPQPTDLIYVYKWNHASFPNETIYGLYNVSDVVYPTSGLTLPITPQFDEVFPVIQVRNNKEWYHVYETAPIAKRIEDTFKRYKMGKLDTFLDKINSSGTLDDISDMFFVSGLDLYSPKRVDNKYLYMFWKGISDDTGSALNKGNGLRDLNFFLIEEGEYNQYITFRDVDVTGMVPIDYTDKTLLYSHRWEIDGPNLSVTAPWAGQYVPNNEVDEEQRDIYVPAEDSAFSRKYKRIEKLSKSIYILEVKTAGGALLSTIKVHGIQQNHNIFFGDTSRSIWAENLADETNDTNVNAENLANFNDEDYTGDNGTAFLIPLIHPTINDSALFTNKEKNSIAARSLFIQMYAAEVQSVPWWQEVLAFVIEAFQLFQLVLTIITLGAALTAITSLEILFQFLYAGAKQWLRSAMFKILIKETGKLIGEGNTAVILLLYAIYEGDFDSIFDFDKLGLEQLGEALLSIAEIVVKYEFDEQKDKETDRLEKELKKLEDKGKDTSQIKEGDTSSEHSMAFVMEDPQEFLARTMSTQITDIVDANMVKYGYAPSSDSKFSYVEDLLDNSSSKIDSEFYSDISTTSTDKEV